MADALDVTPKKQFLDLCNELLLLIIEHIEIGEPYFVEHCRVTMTWRERFSLDDLRNLSLVNKRLRVLSIPTLFQSATTLDCRSNRTPLDMKLHMLAAKPWILEAIRYFTVRTWKHYDMSTVAALWRCLEHMPALQEICFRERSGDCLNSFDRDLVGLLEFHLEKNPNVHALGSVHSISLYTAPSVPVRNMLRLMPNIKNACIEVIGPIRACVHLENLSELPQLEYLMLCRMVPKPRGESEVHFNRYGQAIGWIVDDIRGIAEMVPKLKHLALVGQLHHGLQFGEGDRLSEYIKPFGKLTQLERLDMTDEYVINENEDPESDERSMDTQQVNEAAFNSYADAAENHPLHENRAEVARKFFDNCPALERLYLTRCGSGHFFECSKPEREVKMTRSVEFERGDHFYEPTHEFPFNFPRVLEIADTPVPAA